MKDILAESGRERRDLVHILHRVQAEFGYIPADAVARIAEHINITENEVYGVLTFYRAFRLEPRGRYIVTVCMGTSCHVRGGAEVFEKVKRELQIGPGQTTPDRVFSLETVNCFGCCAIGPTVVVNDRYYSQVSVAEVRAILDEYRASE